jgi:hypothetical protein
VIATSKLVEEKEELRKNSFNSKEGKKRENSKHRSGTNRT